MNTASATAIHLRISNWDKGAEVHQMLIARVGFPTYEAALAFVASLPKTAQRRVFVSKYHREGLGFVVSSDGDLRQSTALVQFRRFVKATVATGAPIVFDEREAGPWYPAIDEAMIRAAFQLEDAS